MRTFPFALPLHAERFGLTGKWAVAVRKPGRTFPVALLGSDPDSEAAARCFSASPDLEAALVRVTARLMEGCDPTSPEGLEAVAEARAALAKSWNVAVDVVELREACRG